MRPRRRSTHRVVATLGSVAVLVAASCSGTDEAWAGDVTIGVSLEAGQRWHADGLLVERGDLCSAGIRHVVEGIDPTTDEVIPVRLWFEVVEAAIDARNTTEITFVVEHTCADGSGSFVTEERWGPDVWSVESGTGAYRGMTGGGELAFEPVDYMQAAPLMLSLEGTLER